MGLKKTFLYIGTLFVIILPFKFFEKVWISLSFIFVYFLIAYLINKIILTKALQKRNFSELRDSRKMLKGEGFVLEQHAYFGNLTVFSKKKYNAHEYVNFQIRESGIFVRTWESVNFGILYKDITRIELIDISPGTTSEYNKFSCFMRIITQHNEREEFLFRFLISEEFVHWLLPVHKGELVYKTYDEFMQETK